LVADWDDERPTMSAEQFRLLKDHLQKASGITLREDLKFVAERRLWPRLEALGLKDFGQYYRFLRFDRRAHEEEELAADALVPHETYFFREPVQLKSFEGELLPRLHKDLILEKRLRMWSAGCSTGEEPYTLSMLVLESGLFDGWDIEILGSDLSRHALSRARKAEYGASAMRATSDERKQRFFDPLPEGRFKVKDAVRARVNFAHLNLIDRGGVSLMPPMHVIFCRNVLIYFDAAARQQVVTSFRERLTLGGYLLLGHSEVLHTLGSGFELVQLEGDLLYRRPPS
jgi:chemotaxis protein methyltransferase CheR